MAATPRLQLSVVVVRLRSSVGVLRPVWRDVYPRGVDEDETRREEPSPTTEHGAHQQTVLQVLNRGGRRGSIDDTQTTVFDVITAQGA